LLLIESNKTKLSTTHINLVSLILKFSSNVTKNKKKKKY